MVLKLYFNLMSQPARAVYMFLKTTQIPFVECQLNLRKGEHLTEEYTKVNPFKKVPAIEHDGFTLTESIAILRYLVREFSSQVPDHFYPKDSKQRARVDEFLEWQHLDLRLYGGSFFRTKYIDTVMRGLPLNDAKLKQCADGLELSLQKMEDIMLTDGRPFLCGSEISVADLIGASEVEQPWCSGYDVFRARPKLRAWMNNTRNRLKPHYDEAHVVINKMAQKLNVDKDGFSSNI